MKRMDFLKSLGNLQDKSSQDRFYGLLVGASLASISTLAAYSFLNRRSTQKVSDEAKQPGTSQKLSKIETLKCRQLHCGPNLTLSFKKDPLCIVKGSGCHLYTEDGQEILDCVNNVAHVGHSHPRLAQVAYRQLNLINTNSRYLCPIRASYVQKLASTLPEGLDVVFLVNSGSEANDLALRLARAYTKKNDVIIVDSAYHGHLTNLIEMSPYKYERKGGFSQKGWVHKAALPDIYRGEYTDPRTAGALYAQQIDQIVEHAVDRNIESDTSMGEEIKQSYGNANIAAFFCESMLSCAGQIIPPEGYLKNVYNRVRAAGGVCVADEVQTGFGRTGESFWAFQLQDVTPDIVTFGKSIANGHPMGAVVTTREIAESFNNGMEYFNTCGGCNLSCAMAKETLDIVLEEKLMENAKTVGSYLLKELFALQSKHGKLIGDVRGIGLFAGLDIVKDVKNKTPDAEAASYIQYKCKILNVQISVDGKYDNVLKFKPPLCITIADIDRLVAALDQSMTEYEKEFY